MNDTDTAAYAFLSVARRGLAALVKPGAAATDPRLGVPVSFSLGGTAVTGMPTVAFRGPGDIVGFDGSAVRRTWPAPDAVNAEPNYFALVELNDADLPWRYTPDATAGDRLAPWLCLIVVEDGELGEQIPATPGRPLASVTVTDAGALPDLSQSWAWAHAQILGRPDAPAIDFDASAAGALFEQTPSRLLARLLCPRQLHPLTSYHAFAVPSFERGRLAGLGLPVDGVDRLAPAWKQGQGPVTLPVYWGWSFQTGEEGDFAALVTKLQALADVPKEVWQRQLAVSPPGAAPPAWQAVDLEGALLPYGAAIAKWPDIDTHGFTAALAARTNARGPRLEPPLYGRWLAAAGSLLTDPAAMPPWFHELNGDPRARVAAGLGTVVVQTEQQQLLASAWAQVAGIRAANETLRLAQLARELALRLYTRHLSALDAPGLLQVSAPLHGQVLSGSTTVVAQVAASPVAPGALAPAWRRVTRPLGTLAVRQGRPAQPPPAAGQDAIAQMNSGALSIVPPHPAPPAGATGAAARLGDLGAGFAAVHVAPEKLQTVTPPSGFTLSYLHTIAPVVAPTVGTLAPAAAPAEGTLPPSAAPPAGPVPPPAAPPAGPVHPPVGPPAGTIAPAIAGFGHAVGALMAQLAQPPAAGTTWIQADLGAANTAIKTALDPRATIEAPLVKRLGGVVAGPRRTDPLEPVMAAPSFPQPMYRPLTDLDRAWLLPGLSAMPADVVAAFTTNWDLVESFLAGLNHELARKLLWNGYPTDQRGTYFKHFWDTRGNVAGAGDGDIGPIHAWTAPLGQNRLYPVDPLVLLVRGELIRRYPNVIVYAAAAQGTPPNRRPGPEELQPMFFARVDPDIALFGFDLDPKVARGDPGWFFVLQEHPSEPRFGLAAPTGAYGVQAATWEQLAWDHLAASADQLAALRTIDLNATLPPDPVQFDPVNGPFWHGNTSPGSRAGDIAHITLRHPKRLAVHGSRLIPEMP
jgi:hypothetical protein